MAYKVFLVEDEIVTREGIRDNVNWSAAGFEFCGEAANGENALPLIEEKKPDVIITDIKMPFMDGLQLSKIVRSHMPWVKIVILSGHDEFNFAQSAVKLGITEYLLKPISAADLHKVLIGLSKKLDEEKTERNKLKQLQNSLQDNLALAQEKFIFNLVSGGISSTEAMEQALQYGLDIIAKFYLVILIKIEPPQSPTTINFEAYHQVEQRIGQISRDDSEVFLTKKDLEEIILLVKGNDLEQLVQESQFRADLIKEKIAQETGCTLSMFLGSPQERLGSIHRSFAEALIKSKTSTLPGSSQPLPIQPQALKLDHSAIEAYIKFGTIQDFKTFFDLYLKPVAQIGVKTPIIKQYLMINMILTANQYLSDLGIDGKQLVINIDKVEEIINKLDSLEKIYTEIKKIFSDSINARNLLVNNEQALMEKVRDYINKHFTDPDLKMSELAKEFNLNPTYFSALFKQESGETFREYLCRVRIEQAKTLLLNSRLKSSEIAYRTGYNDPHYFSYIFKKKTGKSPQEFRQAVKEK